MLTRFEPAPHAGMNRELLMLKDAHGGTLGILTDGSSKVEVLKLNETTLVAQEKPNQRLVTAAELDGLDLHHSPDWKTTQTLSRRIRGA